VLDSESCGLLFPTEFFSSGCCELLIELLDALVLSIVDTAGLFEVGCDIAAALF
jgi:hypothetical protein